ncbi:FadR/GntR family transcriptional regulator [Aureimonas mangrovi]|uniref:FadR/GntR family transcriptional regulator n=1 Tax=Aureimonas mangrovi TaxID=2758041 RepID=UPI00163DAA2B|nr:FadR/GntR family transcriptional regulator [Aureimonas mangrovi]
MEGGQLRTSHAMVVGQLGRAIVDGTLPAGSILPGDGELISRFGVSRTVLREAMKTLAAKRLVEPKAKVGTRVLGSASWNLFDADVLSWRIEAGVDEAFIQHLAEIRLALEPAAASLAARHASERDVLRLYEIAGRMNDLSHTPESVARVDLEFHQELARASRNPFMVSAGGVIEAALALSFKLSSPARTREEMEELARNHLRIVQAVAAGDGEKAATAMRLVIDTGAGRASLALRQTAISPQTSSI